MNHNRKRLLTQLQQYCGMEIEQSKQQRMISFLEKDEDCFQRSNHHGHFTASAWLLNHNGDRALLTLHKKLNKWIQLGGHADGDCDLLAVAIREAQEESGLLDIEPISTDIFDIDIHAIPAIHGDFPHFHYDVRFLLRTYCENDIIISPESLDLQWFDYNTLRHSPLDPSVLRLTQKWHQWYQNHVGELHALST